MSHRRELPQRRLNQTFTFVHEWEKGKPFQYRCTVGYYEDGILGEVFLNSLKHDTSLDANARDAAVFLSIALQYGAPLSVLRRAMQRDTEGYAASPLGLALDEIARRGLEQLE